MVMAAERGGCKRVRAMTIPSVLGNAVSITAKGAREIAGQGLRIAKNFLDGGFGDRATAAYGNGEYGWATAYVAAGTVYGVVNGLTLGEAGGVSKLLTTSLTKLESLFVAKSVLPGSSAAKGLAGVPGRVGSRINLSNEGM
jgi:hypothetical protein